jgi:hypothetical protein
MSINTTKLKLLFTQVKKLRAKLTKPLQALTSPDDQLQPTGYSQNSWAINDD